MIEQHFTRLHMVISSICAKYGLSNEIKKELHLAMEMCENSVKSEKGD